MKLPKSAQIMLGLAWVGAFWMPARACINLYTEKLHGEATEYDPYEVTHYIQHLSAHEHDAKEWLEKGKSFEEKLNQDPRNFELRADLAASLIFQNQYKPALAALEELEQEKPGEYVIAGNLGTAYELDGQNARALAWIREGVKRNPASHEGTEWLHVRILEAKLELEKDPAWLDSHSVLGLDFGSAREPVIPKDGPLDHLGARHSIADTVKALEYQLHERIAFVKPPDVIVGNLLSDLACLVAQERALPHAEAVMKLALTYPPKPSTLQTQRYDFFAARAAEANKKHDATLDTGLRWKGILLASAVGLGALVVLRVLLLRARRNKLTA